MEIKGGAKYALVEANNGGMTTSSYRTLEELVIRILSSQEDEFVKKVRDEIIPEIITKYESDEMDDDDLGDNPEYNSMIEQFQDEEEMY